MDRWQWIKFSADFPTGKNKDTSAELSVLPLGYPSLHRISRTHISTKLLPIKPVGRVARGCVVFALGKSYLSLIE